MLNAEVLVRWDWLNRVSSETENVPATYLALLAAFFARWLSWLLRLLLSNVLVLILMLLVSLWHNQVDMLPMGGRSYVLFQAKLVVRHSVLGLLQLLLSLVMMMVLGVDRLGPSTHNRLLLKKVHARLIRRL